MKKIKKKKIALIVIVSMILALAIGILFLFMNGTISFEDGSLLIDLADGDFYEDKAKEFSETVSVEIFFYGEPHDFTLKLPIKKIDRISEETTFSEKEYRVILLNDMKNRIILSDEEYSFLYDWVYKQHNAFVYIGQSQYNLLQNYGFDLTGGGIDYLGALMYYNTGYDGIRYLYGVWEAEGQKIYDTKRKRVLDDRVVGILEMIFEER